MVGRRHRSTRVRLAVAVGLALLFAGCLGLDSGGAEDVDTASGDDGAGEAEQPSQEGDEQTPREDEETSGEPTTHRLDGHYTAEAANAGLDGANRSMDVPVPQGAGGLVVELAWDGDGVFELYALPPTFCEEAPGPVGLYPVGSLVCRNLFVAGYEEDAYRADDGPLAGESPLRIELDGDTLAEECPSDEDPCPWEAFARPELAVDASFTMVASVFPGEIPEGYSALDGSS